MGILQQIRTKLGVSPEMPDSAALAHAARDLNARINQNRADAAAIEASIPGAVIASIDGAATERRKLERLESEHTALVRAADAIRREIVEARAHERAIELGKSWDNARERAGAVLAAATRIDEIVSTLAVAIAELRDEIIKFEASLPARAPDYDSSLQRNAAASAMDGLKARLLSASVIPSLRALAEDETAVALRVRLLTKKPKQESGEKAALGE